MTRTHNAWNDCFRILSWRNILPRMHHMMTLFRDRESKERMHVALRPRVNKWIISNSTVKNTLLKLNLYERSTRSKAKKKKLTSGAIGAQLSVALATNFHWETWGTIIVEAIGTTSLLSTCWAWHLIANGARSHRWFSIPGLLVPRRGSSALNSCIAIAAFGTTFLAIWLFGNGCARKKRVNMRR